MNLTVEASSEEILAAAEAYFEDCQYNAIVRNEADILASTHREFSWLTGIACLLGGFYGIALYLSYLSIAEQVVRLSVTAQENRTVVMTEGSEESRILLDEWISSTFD